MSDYHYGVNVLSLLNELAAHDTDDIHGGDFEVEGESPSGVSGFATVDIPMLAEDAAKMIVALQQKLNAMAAENAYLKDSVTMHAAGFAECSVCGHEEPCETHDIVWMAKKTPATDAYLNSVRAGVIKSVPTVCDGKEQAAFEDYARSKGLDLSQHPLHYLFLDDKTNTARNAWRECLNYVAEQLRSGTHDTADKAG